MSFEIYIIPWLHLQMYGKRCYINTLIVNIMIIIIEKKMKYLILFKIIESRDLMICNIQSTLYLTDQSSKPVYTIEITFLLGEFCAV